MNQYQVDQYRSAYRPRPARNTPLKSLAAKIAVAALMIAGSTGVVVAATSSSAPVAAPTAWGGSSPVCQPGYVVVDNVCSLENK
jgi:hypothetical protein